MNTPAWHTMSDVRDALVAAAHEAFAASDYQAMFELMKAVEVLGVLERVRDRDAGTR